MEELVDLPVMAPILDTCRLGPSGQLSDLHRFKKLYLSAKVPGMGEIIKCIFCTSAGRLRFGTSQESNSGLAGPKGKGRGP